MLIREFFSWAERANAGERADAASTLAQAFLYADLDPIDAGDAGRALTLLLDDPSPLVRRALAEAFASSNRAPHHILATLAGDRSDIASIVLERSSVLSDAELIDAVAIGDEISQCAVARRLTISAALAGAIAEVGGAKAVLSLSRNGGAILCDFAVGRMLDRFGQDGTLREALSGRDDLGAEMRHALVIATAQALGAFAQGCGWMTADRSERIIGEAQDRATVAIASAEISSDVERRRFVSYLRAAGYLTPVFVLRTLLSGNLALVETILCDLSGKASDRVTGILHNPHGLGFVALYRMTGLPAGLMPAFQAALIIVTETEGSADHTVRLDPRLVEHVITVCTSQTGEDLHRLTALLRRFQAEAARDEARAGLDRIIATERLSPQLRARSGRTQAWLPARRVAA